MKNIVDHVKEKARQRNVKVSEAKTAKEEQEKNKDKNEREGWGSHVEFILSCIGYSVGLGNVWRFPYLAYANGGGAFLIPYFISVLIAGLPLYFLELSLGQFSSLGPNGVFKNIAPAFQGIGWGMVVVSLLVALYYNMIIAWVLFYFFHSFRADLMWSNCRNDYNNEFCHSNIEENNCVAKLNDSGAIFYNKTCYTALEVSIEGINETYTNLARETPAEQFFEKYMLERSPTFEQTGSMSWKLVLCLAGSWLLVFACLFKGVKSTGKVVYFTATFPYVVLLILLIRGVTLEGAGKGLEFYMYPDITKLADWKVWKDAAEQVFFSLGPAFGGLMTMASYNKFNTNCKRDAIMIACIDSFTSTFAGCAIFSILGFLAHEMNVPVGGVTKSGMGLAFIAYPEAIVRMPIPPLWSILFFFMLVTLGLDSEFAMLETVTTSLLDTFPKLLRYKSFLIGGMCVSLFLLGLPFCTQTGIYVFYILNDYAAGYCVVILALVECIVISWVYGIKRFLQDCGMMLGSPPRYYWMATLAFFAPAYLIFVLVASFVGMKPSTYGEYVLPSSAQAIGWCLSLLSILCIPAFAIYHVVKCYLNKKSFRTLITPTSDWCPAEERKKKRPNVAVANEEVWVTRI